ncbi:seed maturation protein, partial [Trifolium pratense]
MQAAKKAVENMKETAANMGASAKSGMEKTKATVQEK